MVLIVEGSAGAINEVHNWGQMQLHRGDARQKTVAEPTEEAVGRAPLRRRWGRSQSRDKKSSNRLFPAAVMVVRKQGNYLYSGGWGIRWDQVCNPRLTLQPRTQHFYIRACTDTLRLAFMVLIVQCVQGKLLCRRIHFLTHVQVPKRA